MFIDHTHKINAWLIFPHKTFQGLMTRMEQYLRFVDEAWTGGAGGGGMFHRGGDLAAGAGPVG